METKIQISSVKCTTEILLEWDGNELDQTQEVWFNDDEIRTVVQFTGSREYIKYGYHLPEESMESINIYVKEAWLLDESINQEIAFGHHEELEMIIKNEI